MRRAVEMAVLSGLALGCQPVEPSGTPFRPVAVETAAGAIPAAAFSTEPKFRMSFDGVSTKVESGPAELVEKSKEKEEEKDEPTPLDGIVSAALASPAPEQQATVSATGTAITALTPTSAPPVGSPNQVGGWPVRLVQTIPDAQPPRAILGLPNGKEIVVTPGAMIPEEGLVVVAIGPGKVQLSQVVPQGDHASISSFTLQAMY